MGIQCFFDYSSKVYCEYGGSTIEDVKCGDVTFCKVIDATPYLAALIIVLAACAFVAKAMR